MAEKWLAYGRWGSGSDLHFTIKLESERLSGKAASTVRAATPEEIAAEKASRAERQKQCEIQEKFKARLDYQDAKAIASILEWIEPNDHPLDRLTPAEWAKLRRKLTA